nr:MAG TPA: hypothetical protein [Caudoviricetes sp.]
MLCKHDNCTLSLSPIRLARRRAGFFILWMPIN